jgi:hypothetical protein
MSHEHVNSLDLDPMPRPKERVGSERADGRGTNGPDDDGFTLAVGKENVKLVRIDVLTWQLPATKTYDKNVSRAHSLETIQLAS